MLFLQKNKNAEGWSNVLNVQKLLMKVFSLQDNMGLREKLRKVRLLTLMRKQVSVR